MRDRDYIRAIFMLQNRHNRMRQRVNRPNYKKRGIKIAPKWCGSDGVINFILWALKNGFSPELTLDRRNNDKGYSPSNCRWITLKENIRNASFVLKVRYDGKTISLKELGERTVCKVPYHTLKARVKNGWPLKEALTRPANHGNAWARGTR